MITIVLFYSAMIQFPHQDTLFSLQPGSLSAQELDYCLIKQCNGAIITWVLGRYCKVLSFCVRWDTLWWP